MFTILLTTRLNLCHGSEMMQNIQQMEVQIKDGVMVILHTTTLKSLNQTANHKEILPTKKSDQMFGLPSTKTFNQLPTGDQTSHQLLETSSHIKALLQFQSSLTQAGKNQHQQLKKPYKLNSSETQKELTSWIQSLTKLEPTKPPLIEKSKSKEPHSTDYF